MDKYCSGSSIPEIQFSDKGLEHDRKMRETKFYNSYDKVIDFSKNPSKVTQFLGVFAAEATVMFILMILIVISLIIFSLHCCCNFWKSDENKSKWGIVSVILLITLVLLYIVFIVFIGLSQNKYNSAVCLIYRIPGGMIEGF